MHVLYYMHEFEEPVKLGHKSGIHPKNREQQRQNKRSEIKASDAIHLECTFVKKEREKKQRKYSFRFTNYMYYTNVCMCVLSTLDLHKSSVSVTTRMTEENKQAYVSIQGRDSSSLGNAVCHYGKEILNFVVLVLGRRIFPFILWWR